MRGQSIVWDSHKPGVLSVGGILDVQVYKYLLLPFRAWHCALNSAWDLEKS